MAKLSTAKADLIDAAVELFAVRGYEGVGVAEMLETAGAPRGSLYFHFPGGKEEIAVEAVRRFGEDGAQRFRALAETDVTLDQFIERVFKTVAKDAKEKGFNVACPLIAVAADVSRAQGDLGAAVHEAFASWEQEIVTAAMHRGVNARDAADFASALVTALEGATVLSKSHGANAPFVSASNALKAYAAQLIKS
jgi:TetR/AcrR family transcriptional repressor of lmrAB and yxaGH operons